MSQATGTTVRLSSATGPELADSGRGLCLAQMVGDRLERQDHALAEADRAVLRVACPTLELWLGERFHHPSEPLRRLNESAKDQVEVSGLILALSDALVLVIRLQRRPLLAQHRGRPAAPTVQLVDEVTDHLDGRPLTQPRAITEPLRGKIDHDTGHLRRDATKVRCQLGTHRRSIADPRPRTTATRDPVKPTAGDLSSGNRPARHWCRKEAGHVLLHGSEPGRGLPRPVKEVEAESVAFVAGSACGLRSDLYSFPYVAAWAGADPAAVLAATASRVAAAADRIVSEVADLPTAMASPRLPARTAAPLPEAAVEAAVEGISW